MSRLLRINVFLLLASIAAVLCRRLGLGSTHAYGITVRGEPFWMSGPDGLVEEIGGFYTTRYVLAGTPEEAESSALRILTGEMRNVAMNPADSPVQLAVEDCTRLSGVISWHGGGFTFWVKGED